MQHTTTFVKTSAGLIVLMISLLLLFSPAQGQDLLRKLEKQYHSSQPEHPAHFYLTGKYAQALFFNDQIGEAFDLLSSNIRVAEKRKDSKYAAYLLSVYAISLQLVEEQKEALRHIAKAKSILSNTRDNEIKGYVYYAQGWLQARHFKEGEAVRSFLTALNYLDKAPSSASLLGRKASVYKELTAIYSNWGELKSQEKYSKLALALATEQQDPAAIFDAYMALGHLNELIFLNDESQTRNRDQAESYYLKALATYQEHEHEIPIPSNLSFVANNLAHLYFRFFPESHRSKAQQYAELAKTQGLASKAYNHVSSAYGIMAEMAIQKKDYTQGKAYLLAALSNMEQAGNQDQHILMSIYESLSQISEAEEKYAEAIGYYKSYITIFKRIYDQDQLQLGKRLEAQYEKGKQEQEVLTLQLEAEKKEQQLRLMEALGMQQKQDLENMKLVQDNQGKELALARMKADKQNQALRLSKLEAENKAQEISNYQQEISFREKINSYFILSFSTILLLFLLLLYAYQQRAKHMKQKEVLHTLALEQERQHSKISTLTALLQGQETERGRLARDLHDGLGGLLSGTKLQLTQLQDPSDDKQQEQLLKTMGHLDLAVEELRRVAHNLMPDLLQKYGLQEALSDYANRMSSERLDVDVQFLHMQQSLSLDQQLIVYRIIQELVNNAIKHAFPSQILIQLVEEEQQYHVTVEDDGCGFNVNQQQKTGSAGLHNIQSRIEFLKGTLQVESVPQQGTSIEFHFPKTTNS